MSWHLYDASFTFFSLRDKNDFCFDSETLYIEWKNAGDMGWILHLSSSESQPNIIETEFVKICKEYGVSADINYEICDLSIMAHAHISTSGYVHYDDSGDEYCLENSNRIYENLSEDEVYEHCPYPEIKNIDV